MTLSIKGRDRWVQKPQWLIKEKLIFQNQRGSFGKRELDLDDIEILADLEDNDNTLDDKESAKALKSVLEQRPSLYPALKRVVRCGEVFH